MKKCIINGHSVEGLVDTGAGCVLISKRVADRIDLPYRPKSISLEVLGCDAKAYETIGEALIHITVDGVKLMNREAYILPDDVIPCGVLETEVRQVELVCRGGEVEASLKEPVCEEPVEEKESICTAVPSVLSMKTDFHTNAEAESKAGGDESLEVEQESKAPSAHMNDESNSCPADVQVVPSCVELSPLATAVDMCGDFEENAMVISQVEVLELKLLAAPFAQQAPLVRSKSELFVKRRSRAETPTSTIGERCDRRSHEKNCKFLRRPDEPPVDPVLLKAALRRKRMPEKLCAWAEWRSKRRRHCGMIFGVCVSCLTRS